MRRVKDPQHWIELFPEDMRPIQSVPYRAGPKVHDFEKNEIIKTLELEVIAQAQTQCTSPIVFLQELTAHSDSVLNK